MRGTGSAPSRASNSCNTCVPRTRSTRNFSGADLRFSETPLAGAFELETAPHSDERGSFARLWCQREFAAHGLPAPFVQSSMSRNLRRGTVRGMHMQLPPSREARLVRCARGRIFDVIIDLRPGSPTFLHHHGAELTAERNNALFVPAGFLHGFQTLADDCD